MYGCCDEEWRGYGCYGENRRDMDVEGRIEGIWMLCGENGGGRMLCWKSEGEKDVVVEMEGIWMLW